MIRIGIASVLHRVHPLGILSLRLRLSLALAIFVFSAFAVAAQAPARLTLHEALDRAARRNLDLAAARLRRAVSEAGVRIAGRRPNPTVSFDVTRDAPHESLLFEQPLEIGGQRGRRMEVARRGITLADLEYAALERRVRRGVREAYYGAALSRGVTAFQQRSLDLAKRLQEIAQARFDAGDVPQLEVFQASLGVTRAETDLEVSRQQERIALNQLNMLLNEPAGADWELATPMDEPPPPLAMEELVTRAEQSNPELQHLAQEQRIEEARRLLLQAERTPHVTAAIAGEFNSPPEFRAGLHGHLAVELPLFSRNQGEIAQSRANSRVLESEATATRRAVAGRSQTAYLALSVRRTQVELFRSKLLPAGRRLADLAQESYRAGKASILTVLDAQRNAQQLEREYLENSFGLQFAFAELEETVGASLD